MARSSNIDVALRLRGQRQFSREVGKAAADLEKMGVRGAGALGKFAQQSQSLKDFGRNMTTKVTLPIVAMGGLAVKAASDWESAFAGVRKTVDATEGQFAHLESGIREMALQIPVSAGEIAGIAEAAGQLGIKTKNILGFSRVMADLGVATNMTSEQAATQLARFANITQMPQKSFDRLGSTVVALGNNFATTESEIVGMGARIAGAGTQVGMSQAQIMGFAAGLSSLGVSAEAGGTSFSKSMKLMNTAVIGGGDELEAFAETAGVTSKEFADAFEQDAGNAMVFFIDGLKQIKADGGDVSEALNDLGLRGDRVQDMFLRAVSGGDELRNALGMSTDAWKENTALTEEAEQRYKTFESQLQIMKNVLNEVGIQFAQNVLPHLTKFVEWLGPKIQGALKWFGGLPGPVQAAAAGFVGLLAAIGPVSWMLGMLAGGVGKFLIVAVKVGTFLPKVTMAFRLFGLMMLTNPVFLVVAGLVALVGGLVLAYHKVGWFRDAVDAAFAWIKTAAKNAANWVIGAAKWIGRAFQNVRNWVTNAIGNVVAFVKKRWPLIIGIMLGPIGVVTALVITNFGKIKSAASSVVNWVKDRFNAVVGFMKSLPGKITAAASGMWEGVKSGFAAAINWVIGKWNDLVEGLSGSFLGKVAGKVGVDVSSATLGTIPTQAEGGVTTRPGLSWVGERGPEILDLPRAARVIPLNREVIRETVGGGIRGPFIFQSVLDGKVVAETVVGRLEDARAAA